MSSRVYGWPVRLYCHLLGLGVLSISHFPIPHSQIPSTQSQSPILVPNPQQSQSQSLDNSLNVINNKKSLYVFRKVFYVVVFKMHFNVIL